MQFLEKFRMIVFKNGQLTGNFFFFPVEDLSDCQHQSSLPEFAVFNLLHHFNLLGIRGK